MGPDISREHRHRTMAKEKYNKHINIERTAIFEE
jgi:hypothetical protein